MSDRPISDYALLSDCRSAALIARDGSLDWLCLPRFDSPAQFARLLGPHAGHWRIGPAERATVTRRYLPSSLVLETRFTTESGSAVLCDALATGADEHGHDLGRNSPHALLRTLECTAGEIVIDVEYAPRPEYGLIRPLLRRIDGGLLGRGGASVLCLSTTIPLHVDGATATAPPMRRASGSPRRSTRGGIRRLRPGRAGPGCISPTRGLGRSRCCTAVGSCRG